MITQRASHLTLHPIIGTCQLKIDQTTGKLLLGITQNLEKRAFEGAFGDVSHLTRACIGSNATPLHKCTRSVLAYYSQNVTAGDVTVWEVSHCWSVLIGTSRFYHLAILSRVIKGISMVFLWRYFSSKIESWRPFHYMFLAKITSGVSCTVNDH